MIGKKISSALNIRPGEWKETIFFWSFCFFVWFAVGVGDATADSLFIKRVGVEQLPVMFILCALIAIPVSLILTIFHGRIEKRSLTLYSGIVSAALIILAVNMVSHSDALPYPVLSFYFLYLVSNSLQYILPVILSVLIGTQFNSLKGKRLVPVIFTGAMAGRIAAGISLSWLAVNYSLNAILWFWLIIHSFGFLIFALGSNNYVRAQIQNFIESKAERRKPPMVERLRRFFGSAMSSRLVLFLILSSLFLTLSFYFAEFQCAEIFNKKFASENELARFYGLFTIFSSVLAFLFQGMITGNLIQRLGISNTNILFPTVVFISFGFTFFSFSFIPGVWLKFVMVGLGNALFQPVNNLFYNALPVKEKARIITINEGVLLPLGTVLTGLFLLYAGSNQSLVKFIPLLFGLAWMILASLMKKPYRDGLLHLLKSSNLQFDQPHQLEKLSLDRNTMALLLSSLEQENEETGSMIVQLVFNNGDRERREAIIKRLLKFSAEKRAKVLEKAVLPIDNVSAEFLFRCLEEDNVKLHELALKSLARFSSSERLRTKIEMFLNSSSEELRRLAAVILVRIGDLDQMLQSLKILQDTIYSNQETEKLKGIEIIGFTGDERFWVNLKPYLVSNDTRIRLAAAKSLEKMVKTGESEELYDTIGLLVKDSSREIRYLALKILERLSHPKWFYHVVEGLSDSSPRNRQLAQRVLVSHYDDKLSELITVLESPASSLHAKTTVAGILAVSQDQSIREYLHQFGQKMIQLLYEYKVEEFILMRDLGRENSRYICMLLNEKAWALTKLIVCLVAPEQNREARDLFKSLYSSNEELISNAIEVLQNMGERQLVYHIIPVLENISLENIANYGMRVFAIRDRSAGIILGKFLSHSDIELKEAAAYTISRAEFLELIPAVKKIMLESSKEKGLYETCRWAIDRLESRKLAPA